MTAIRCPDVPFKWECPYLGSLYDTNSYRDYIGDKVGPILLPYDIFHMGI